MIRMAIAEDFGESIAPGLEASPIGDAVAFKRETGWRDLGHAGTEGLQRRKVPQPRTVVFGHHIDRCIERHIDGPIG
ncbi:hypothetical protein D9M72_627080 [compost metagenome]